MDRIIRAIFGWLARYLASKQPNDFASRIVRAMERNKYTVDRKPGEINIIYLEGADDDGTVNDDEPNEFNDRRIVLTFKEGKPFISGNWEATCEPGKRYTVRTLPGVDGAARIKFGQYRAWQVGIHRSHHEALVQTGGAVTVCRDVNKDYERDGDRETTGYYGINQHHGYDMPVNDIGGSSAGCLVGRTVKGHSEFMAIVKSDPRYLANNKFVFSTAILPAKDI